MDRLEYILFEKDVRPEGYTYRYYSELTQDSISIRSRYPVGAEYHKEPHVRKLCDSLRSWQVIHDMPRLRAILKRQESLFRTEWEPAIKHGIDGLWRDQLDVLCTIDLTLSFLTTIEEEWSGAEVYEYAKNLYILNHVKYEPNRRESTIYESKYIRNELKGICRCATMVSREHRSVIDDYLQKSGERDFTISAGWKRFVYDQRELIARFISDVSSASNRAAPKEEQKFIRYGTSRLLKEEENLQIDSLVIHDPYAVIEAGYNDSNDRWSTSYPRCFYHLVKDRYLLSQHPRLLDLILDDMFSSVDVLTDRSTDEKFAIVQIDHLGVYKLIERFVDTIAITQDEEEIQKLITCMKEHVSPRDYPHILVRAEKVFDDNLLTRTNLNRIKMAMK